MNQNVTEKNLAYLLACALLFMPFLPYKLYAQPKHAALPELCLLGENITNQQME